LPLRLAPTPIAASDEAHCYRRLNGFPVIVPGDDSGANGFALPEEITFRGDADLEAGVGGDDGTVPSNFAIAFVGDTGFNAIANVEMVVVEGGGNVDFEFTVGVQLAALF